MLIHCALGGCTGFFLKSLLSRLHIKDVKWGRKRIFCVMQAVNEDLNKSHCGNSHLEMRQNHITIAEHSGHCLPYDIVCTETLSVSLSALIYCLP